MNKNRFSIGILYSGLKLCFLLFLVNVLIVSVFFNFSISTFLHYKTARRVRIQEIPGELVDVGELIDELKDEKETKPPSVSGVKYIFIQQVFIIDKAGEGEQRELNLYVPGFEFDDVVKILKDLPEGTKVYRKKHSHAPSDRICLTITISLPHSFDEHSDFLNDLQFDELK